MGKQAKLKRARIARMQAARELLGVVSRGTFYDYTRRRGILFQGNNVFVDLCEVFDLQHIHDHLAAISGWEIKGCLRLPFNSCFFEWREGGNVRVGVLATSTADNEITTIMVVENPRNGNVFLAGAATEHIDERWGHVKTETRLLRELAYDGVLSVEQKQQWLAAVSGTVMFAVALMNCKNIVTVDSSPDPKDNAIYEREFGVPMTVSKRLAIRSMSKRSEREGDDKEYQGVVRMHIRRGHFAHYTDDAPLFGKYTGTFWKEATVVGNGERGTVNKDYELQPQEA